MMTIVQAAPRPFDWESSYSYAAGSMGMVCFLVGAGSVRAPLALGAAWALTVIGGLLVARPRWGRLGAAALLAAVSCTPVVADRAVDAFVLRSALVFLLLSADGQFARAKLSSGTHTLAPLFWGALQIWAAFELSQQAGMARWLSIPLYVSLGLAASLSEGLRVMALLPQALAFVGLFACGRTVTACVLLVLAGHVVSARKGDSKQTLDLGTVIGFTVLGLSLLLALGPWLGLRTALVPAKNLLGLFGLLPPS